MYFLSGFQVRNFITYVVIIMAIQGCDQTKQKQQSVESARYQQWEETAKKVDDFVYHGPLFLGQTLSRIPLFKIKQLEVIKNERVEYVDNPHIKGKKIELRTFKFDGLVLIGVVEQKNFFQHRSL